MAYSTKQRNLVSGTEVIEKDAPRGRLKNALLDLAALPLVLAGPRRSVRALDQVIALDYDFRQWYWRSERCVEVALAKDVLRRRERAAVLEVGNVLSLSGMRGHTIVDKYEVGPGVRNLDILDFKPDQRFELAISISTLEHVGFDEHPQDLAKAGRALEHLGSLADQLLVTIPAGYHRSFEQAFLEGPFDRVELLVKTSRLASWEPRPLTDLPNIEYGGPFAFGNGILVGSRGVMTT